MEMSENGNPKLKIIEGKKYGIWQHGIIICEEKCSTSDAREALDKHYGEGKAYPYEELDAIEGFKYRLIKE